jgi:hypothetical protein
MRRLLSELSKQFCKFELENSRAVTGHLESADLKGKLPPSAVYEDNAGCVILASDDDKYRARTKHINIKWHHFKDQVRNGSVKIIKVDTTLNWADTLTKPLSRVKLESVRKNSFRVGNLRYQLSLVTSFFYFTYIYYIIYAIRVVLSLQVKSMRENPRLCP